MRTHRTTDKQKVRIYEIATEMNKSGLSSSFIAVVVKLAEYYEGAYDLVELWANEEDTVEKDHIISDLQDEIDEYAEQPKTPLKRPYIKFSDLELIAKDVTGFKAHLKTMVDHWGGISKLAKKQASLNLL